MPPLGGTLEKLLKLPAGSSRDITPADRTWLVRGCEKESRGDDGGEDEFAVLLAVSSLHRAARMPEYMVGSSGWTDRTMMVNVRVGLMRWLTRDSKELHGLPCEDVERGSNSRELH